MEGKKCRESEVTNEIHAATPLPYSFRLSLVAILCLVPGYDPKSVQPWSVMSAAIRSTLPAAAKYIDPSDHLQQYTTNIYQKLNMSHLQYSKMNMSRRKRGCSYAYLYNFFRSSTIATATATAIYSMWHACFPTTHSIFGKVLTTTETASTAMCHLLNLPTELLTQIVKDVPPTEGLEAFTLSCRTIFNCGEKALTTHRKLKKKWSKCFFGSIANNIS